MEENISNQIIVTYNNLIKHQLLLILSNYFLTKSIKSKNNQSTNKNKPKNFKQSKNKLNTSR